MNDSRGPRHAVQPAPVPPAAYLTLAGVEWLLSGETPGQGVRELWAVRPTSPGVLPCGVLFDVVSAPVVTGRAMVEHLWSSGPGSGPVATHRDRVLLFAAPGTAGRLRRLLSWGEWSGDRGDEHGAETIPRLLCLGHGDTVTVPGPAVGGATGSRWLVAPEVRRPWLPPAEALLRAYLSTRPVRRLRSSEA